MNANIIRLEKPEDFDVAIEKAATVLTDGGLVVYPTDTSYGLACDPRNPDALDRLFEVKNRSRDTGVPLLFSDIGQCEEFHDFGGLERVIARLFWPGVLTLVVSAKETVPDYLTGGRSSIAIRVPDHAIPRGIAKQIQSPIVGTSANISGGSSPFEVSISIEQLGTGVDLYIDDGPSKADHNSTIVGVDEEEAGYSSIKVYREGALSIDRLTESLRVDTDALQFWTSRIIYADM
ncbi:MAG: L-threonylcarbamoyladenylate synthase [Candidatus Thorarchaeota archaeon]|nr:L-threonylcarbamoyladenylate synthase [Candidatus Thorarchaeota archaeon]